MHESDRHFAAGWLSESAAVTAAFAADPQAIGVLSAMSDAITASLRAGGKLLIAGNGGSAADAQHMAAEFVVRMNYDRAPLAALALTTDSSVLTAAGNDYGYDHVFARQVQALGRRGDVFLGISTSGRSPTILRALDAARQSGLITLGFTGAAGGAMAEQCDVLLRAPSAVTALIQQIHIIAIHVICSLAERALCPRPGA
ncbi:SIS domain-containing protein [Rhodovastum atsumiense]|uniref:Phosphoheptose isomerase n=1 Tax=Rhodovastum atsumiense TaxID=504468 RepID=A0A5M6IR54_9PROT|nr:SIS domain-containing protein [Rhodovastum atsumiense]KAA5610762.1 SIS domain-containing protein [Rhodovastum atsumiense]